MRWLEQRKDYYMSIIYQSVKDNVVIDDLSRLFMGSATGFVEEKRELSKDVHRLAPMRVRLMDSAEEGIVVTN